jgi:hypothetical protein
VKLIKDEAEARNPAPTAAAAEEDAKRRQVDNPQHLRLRKGLPQLPHRDDGSQI